MCEKLFKIIMKERGFLKMSIVTEQQMIDVKDIREKCIENIDVLAKVKKLFLIPEMEVMTTKMVADYYDVDFGVIQTCYARNKQEIESDGVVKRRLSDFNDSVLKSFDKNQYNISFKIEDYEVIIPNCGVLCFSPLAIIKIGIFLCDSVVADNLKEEIVKTNNTKLIELLLRNKANIHKKEMKLYNILNQAFGENYIIQKQVSCGNYRIDFVINNIAIECDEFGHKNRDVIYERERQNYIEKQGYQIIRYNPDDDTQNVYKLVIEINNVINTENIGKIK